MKTKKLHIKSGDTVKVIAGNEKGKTGVVRKVIFDKSRVIVEGVNIVKKHVKPTAEKPQGGIQEMEASIHISNLMLVDPKSGKATRVGRQKDAKDGKNKRYAKKTSDPVNGKFEFID